MAKPLPQLDSVFVVFATAAGRPPTERDKTLSLTALMVDQGRDENRQEANVVGFEFFVWNLGHRPAWLTVRPTDCEQRR